MKTTTLVLGVIAAASASVSIYLGTQLGNVREQLAQESQGRSAAEARLRALESEQRARSALWPSASEAAPRPEDSPKPDGSMPPGRADRMMNVDISTGGQGSRRIQEQIRLRRMYSEMPSVLGLDTATADKLFDLLADSQMAAANNSRGYYGDRFGMQSLDAAAQTQRDASIEALLGPDKAAEFQSFEKSIPARLQVGRIGEGMAAANVPLSDLQRNSLIAVVVSEQEAGPPPQRPTDGSDDSDYQARFLDWQADYSQRVQARVEPLLSGEQVVQYRQAVEAQNARRAQQQARVAARRNAANGGQ